MSLCNCVVCSVASQWNITTSKFSQSLKNSNISKEQPLELHSRVHARGKQTTGLSETKYPRIEDQSLSPDSHAPTKCAIRGCNFQTTPNGFPGQADDQFLSSILYYALFACAHECLLSSVHFWLSPTRSQAEGERRQHSLFQYFPLKLVWLLSERLQQVSLSRLMAMNTAVNPPQVRAAGWWCWWQPDSQIVLTGSSSNGTGRIHGVYHILVHSWFHLKQTQQLLRHYRRPTFLPDM